MEYKCSRDIVTSVNVRIDKAHLFELDQESGKYSARVVIPKSDQKTIGAIQDGCDAIAAAYPFKNTSTLQLPLHDSDSKGYKGDYEGTMYLNCSSKNPPQIVDRHGKPIKNPNEVYNGMYVRAYFTLKPYDYQREGIRCELTAIQKAKDGERFPDSYSKPTSEFAPITDQDFLA